MTDDLPGLSLGELRAASANLMAAHFAANLSPHALKAAADREEFVARACTVGVGLEDAKRIADEIAEDRSRRGLPLGPDDYRLALARICAEGVGNA